MELPVFGSAPSTTQTSNSSNKIQETKKLFTYSGSADMFSLLAGDHLCSHRRAKSPSCQSNTKETTDDIKTPGPTATHTSCSSTEILERQCRPKTPIKPRGRVTDRGIMVPWKANTAILIRLPPPEAYTSTTKAEHGAMIDDLCDKMGSLGLASPVFPTSMLTHSNNDTNKPDAEDKEAESMVYSAPASPTMSSSQTSPSSSPSKSMYEPTTPPRLPVFEFEGFQLELLKLFESKGGKSEVHVQSFGLFGDDDVFGVMSEVYT